MARLEIYVTDEEKADLKKLSKNRGISISAIVRQLVKQASEAKNG